MFSGGPDVALLTDNGEATTTPLGSRIRVLPNHACATAAQHREYRVIDGKPSPDAPDIEATWRRHNGW